MQNKFAPVKVSSFDATRNWAMIRIGQHHTIALDATGLCLCFELLQINFSCIYEVRNLLNSVKENSG